MPLITYESVRPWAKAIRTAQIDTLTAWVDGVALQGNARCWPDLGTRLLRAHIAILEVILSMDAKQKLDAHVREMVAWHFNPDTGCPFWLDYAAKLDWDPRR